MKALRIAFVGGYFCAAMLPLLWLLLTSLKTLDDSIAVYPKFAPTWASEVAADGIYFRANLDGYRQLAAVYAGGDHAFFYYLGNSLVIGLLSTLCSVLIGTCAAYGFSRFAIPGGRDWLFFILSTRFLPPLAVVVPVLMMYREFDLQNSHLGLVLLYTAFNMSLAVWLMKGFIDEIPTALRRGRVGGWLYPLPSLPLGRPAASRARDGGNCGVLPDLGVERVRVCHDAQQPKGRYGAGLLRWFAGQCVGLAVGPDQRGDADFCRADHRLHDLGAQASVARRHLWDDQAITVCLTWSSPAESLRF